MQKEQRKGRDNVPCKKSREREETTQDLQKSQYVSAVMYSLHFPLEGFPISGSYYYLLILHRDNVVQWCTMWYTFAIICSHLHIPTVDLLPRSSKQTDLQMLAVELHNGIHLEGNQYWLMRALDSKETGGIYVYIYILYVHYVLCILWIDKQNNNDITATSLESWL